jgi:DNA repair exonuclease SbcCD nuclease subunit
MAKIAIITDLHWGVRNNSQFFLERQEEFFYNQFIPYLIKNDIKTIWMLGDFFENRKAISTQVLNKAHQFLQKLEGLKIDSYFLIGNHDIFFKNTNAVNSLVPVTKAFERVHLVEKYEVIDFDGLSVGFISWISPDIHSEALKWIMNIDAQVLCGHFEINSFEIIKGVVCSKGIDSAIFERFDKVFSGHFHIRATNGTIQYIGNPYQTNWGECGYPKGFAVFDTRSKSVEFIDNTTSSYEILQYDDDIEIGLFDRERFAGKIVRVIVDSCKNKKKLEVLLDSIGQVSYSLDVIENKEVVVSDDNQEAIPSDTMQLIQQFLETCKIDHLDKKQLIEIILGIYSEAIEKGVSEC